MLKRILIGLGVVVVVLVAAAVIVPSLIPVATYKTKIETAVQDATGRSFAIKGPVSFSLLPSIAIEANDVSFGNAPGAKNPQMATLKKLVLALKLFPLLRGSVQIDRFVLVEPVINLEVDKSGKGNWVFGKMAAASAAPAGKSGASPSGGGMPGATEIKLGEVRLDGGRITYRDDRTSSAYTIDKIAASVTLPDMESPFGINGQLDWNGKTIKLSAKGNALGKILAGQSSPLNLSLASQPINLGFDGKLSKMQPLAMDGAVKLSVPSVRGLAAWAGSPLKVGGSGLGPLSIDGKLDIAGKRISFANAALALDDMKGKGEVSVETSGPRPHIVAKLDLDKLDLNNYSGAAPGAPAAAAPAKPAGSAPAAAPADWSDQPIDTSGLKAVDADLAFSVGAIEVQKLKIGKSRLETKLKDGVLDANLAELALYGGKGQGRVNLDGRGAAAALKATLDLANVDAEPLLRDATGNDRLSGKASFDFEGAATGKSQRALVSALNGKGKFAFRDGAIKGINLAAMVRNVSTAFLDSGASQTQKTDFSALTGTYTIVNGILTNRDLEMISPLLRVTGTGTVDMPKRTVNYRITPKVVASTEGQGGTFGKGGLAVPVMVTGRWDNLHYAPDLAGTAVEGAKGLIKGLVPGAGGSGTAPSQGSAPSGPTIPNPGKLLKGLFGN